MFKDTTSSVIGFESNWERKSSLISSSAQTDLIEVNEIDTQNPIRCSSSTQTENILQDESVTDFDHDAVSAFIKSKLTLILEELCKTSESHAFDNYDPCNNENQMNEISLAKIFPSASKSDDLQVSSISWNCNGSILSVGYGAPEHEEWCTHNGVTVICWSLNRSDKPVSIIEMENCVTYLSYHPTLPSIIAVGDFTGKISIYNTQEDNTDMMIATSALSDDDNVGHREAVTSLVWIKSPVTKSSSDYQIVSGSLDGKILIWNVKLTDGKVELVDGFLILSENLPASISKKISRLGREVGITSISFNYDDPSIIIISTEGGGLFQCNLNTTMISNSVIPSSIPLKNPIVFGYSGHASQTCSSECSLVRNIFLSAGYDGRVSLYSLLHTKPVMEFQRDISVTSIKWSPVRPLVFALTTYDGKLAVYDLDQNQTSPVIELTYPDEPINKSRPMLCLDFNAEEPKLLATADTNGKIYVWKLSDHFLSSNIQEKEKLTKFSSTSND